MRTVRYTTRKRLGRARCLILRRRQDNGTAPGSDGNCLGHAYCCQSPRIRRRCRRWRCEQPTERRSRQRQPNFDATPRPRPSSDRRVPCSSTIWLVVTRLTGMSERTSTAFARRVSLATLGVSVRGRRSGGRRGVDRVALGGVGHIGSPRDSSRTFHAVGTRAFIQGSCEKSPGRTTRSGPESGDLVGVDAIDDRGTCRVDSGRRDRRHLGVVA